jgi:hypothetical protein
VTPATEVAIAVSCLIFVALASVLHVQLLRQDAMIRKLIEASEVSEALPAGADNDATQTKEATILHLGKQIGGSSAKSMQ